MLESLILRYDVSFHYDSSLYVAFDDFVECSGGNGLMEEGMKDMLGYSNNIVGTRKKHKQNGDFIEVECEDDSEELESGCETYKESGCNRKEYSILNLPKTWQTINEN